MGVLVIRASLFGVCIRAGDFWKLPAELPVFKLHVIRARNPFFRQPAREQPYGLNDLRLLGGSG